MTEIEFEQESEFEPEAVELGNAIYDSFVGNTEEFQVKIAAMEGDGAAKFDKIFSAMEYVRRQKPMSTEFGIWAFHNLNKNLGEDHSFFTKTWVLDWFAEELSEQKDMILQYLKSLSSEDIEELETLDSFPKKMRNTVAELFYEHGFGKVPRYKFVLFSALRVKRLESKVFAGASLESVIEDFASYFVQNFCNGDRTAFAVHMDGALNLLYVANGSYDNDPTFEIRFSEAKEIDFTLAGRMLAKWCSDVEGVEAAIELVAIPK